MLSTQEIFNENYYLADNNDVRKAVAAGIFSSGYEHFLQYGGGEGRNPSLLFDNNYYLENNSDVSAAVANGSITALEHFLQYGDREGRNPSALIDIDYYMINNADVSSAVNSGEISSVFEHLLRFGLNEGRNSSPVFDTNYYLENNADVSAAVANGSITALEHFLQYGILELRNPSSTIDLLGLLSRNTEFSTARLNNNNSKMIDLFISEQIALSSSVVAVIPNIAPVLEGVLSSVSYAKATANSTAQIIDSSVTLEDANSTNFNSGNVTIAYSSGGGINDQLSINNEGGGAEEISFDGTNLSYEGVNIGTVDGSNNGANGTSLIIGLNTNSDVTAIAAMLQNITYQTNIALPAASRTISITINDGDGGTSDAASVIINLIGATPSLTLSSLDGSIGFRIDGDRNGDRSGISVSSAGDINGDGFDDFLIGALTADPSGNASGETYLILGKASGFSAVIDPSTLDGTNGFKLFGIDAFDVSGGSVSSAGDVNGDGFDDIIIGSRGADPSANSSAGESYVIFGKAAEFGASSSLSSLDGTSGFRLDGIDADDLSGASVSSAGDVNGDGFDDIIIGAREADPSANSSAGESYIVFGKAAGFGASFNLSALDGTNGFRLDGIDADDLSGASVSSAGDVNGDGFDDIIIGASGADPSANSSAGESYVIFGKAAGFGASINLSSLDGTNGFRLDGIDADDLSGTSVSSAGDVNGDGFDDIIIGASGADPSANSSAGESYIVFGKAAGFGASLNLSALDGTNGFRLDGIDADDLSGTSVSSAGDVNGDGFGDIIIGAGGADNPGDSSAGESYVVLGKATGFGASFNLSALDGTNGFRLDGIDADDLSGTSVSSAGDVNGDGFDDIIIGAYDAEPPGGSQRGESYVVFGNNDSAVVDQVGTSGADVITGTSGADIIVAGLGNDVITGAAGADVIKAAGGNDTITGGDGADKLYGGTGSDDFIYTDTSESGIGLGNRDIIFDFVSGVDDIDLSDFAGTYSYLGTGAFTGSGSSEVRYVNTGTNTVVQSDLNGNGATDFEIQLQDIGTLSAGDFIL